uniref:Cytochrome P450 n=1 Tax=Timema douglasi TaxID=61478 RepID=A0A7R8Z3E2_TIMDO|nr:unnamed protein product [Timema douglasi]
MKLVLKEKVQGVPIVIVVDETSDSHGRFLKRLSNGNFSERTRSLLGSITSVAKREELKHLLCGCAQKSAMKLAKHMAPCTTNNFFKYFKRKLKNEEPSKLSISIPSFNEEIGLKLEIRVLAEPWLAQLTLLTVDTITPLLHLSHTQTKLSAISGEEMETQLSLSIILSATAVVVFLYWYLTSTFSYWEKRSVPFVKPLPVFGNVADYIFLRNTSPESYAKIYKKLEGHQFGGFYSGSTPNLILRDPVIIKQILMKDFNHFIDRNLSFVEKISPLACHLFSLTGSRWRKLRVKLTPSFTSGKMRMMLPAIVECSQELVSFLGESADDNNIIEIRNIASNFTTDVIGSCGFGLNINSTKNHDSEFLRMGNKVFQPTILACALRSLGLIFRPIMNLVHSPIAKKDVNDFFLGIVKETISYREKNKVVRNDFLQLLIQLKNKGKVDEDLVSIKDDINVTFTEVASSSNESEDEPLGKIIMGKLTSAFIYYFATL